jgi:ubiquinone biosynthesis protein UbiJ
VSALDSLLTEFLNTLTNAGLNLDPRSEARLRSLQGRSVQLIVELPAPASEKSFTVLVDDGRLQILSHSLPQPNAIARGSIPDLLGWLFGGASGGGKVALEGDDTVLIELSAIFRRYSPGISEPMSALLGVKASANILNIAEGAVAALRSTLEGVGSAIQRSTDKRYATRSRLDTLLDVLDDTRARVDRLSERVRAEESRRASEIREPAIGPSS